MRGPIICRRCEVISRGITGHCQCVEELVREKDRQIERLKKKAEELNEVLTPFVFHGKALKALSRKDRATVVSKVGHSYLTLGCFTMLMESVDRKYFGNTMKVRGKSPV
jgi:hypothetical protein